MDLQAPVLARQVLEPVQGQDKEIQTRGVVMSRDSKSKLSVARGLRLTWTSLVAIWSIVAATIMLVESIPAQAADNDAQLLKEAQRVFKPLPKDAATAEFPITPERVELGRKLFFDPRISVDGTVSCSRCHLAALYATDGLPKAKGVFDKENDRRAPTVLNAALQFKEHWRGDRENVEDQATRAPLGPAGFGNPDNATAMARVKAIPGYPELFQKAFPGEPNPVTIGNWGKAIGAYERTLITPAPFDEYLAGNTQALSEPERQGLRTFMDTGCGGCHNGAVVGGGMFQKFGVREDYWKETGSEVVDKGRFDVTHNPSDMYVFKVPGLRNVAMVQLYFHDGSVRTLPEAVRIMAKVELGKTLSAQDTAAIVAFLGSLTGQIPKSFAEAPVLPRSGFNPSPATDVRSAR
jgi:cytochrome c peroxidase